MSKTFVVNALPILIYERRSDVMERIGMGTLRFGAREPHVLLQVNLDDVLRISMCFLSPSLCARRVSGRSCSSH